MSYSLSTLIATAEFASNLPEDSIIEELVVRQLRIVPGSLTERLESLTTWKRLRVLEIGYVDRVSEGGASEEVSRCAGGCGRVAEHNGIVKLTMYYPRSTDEVADFITWFPNLETVVMCSNNIDFTLILNVLGEQVNT